MSSGLKFGEPSDQRRESQETQNKPRLSKFRLNSAVLRSRPTNSNREGNDPKCASQFHCRRGFKGLLSVVHRRADDGACVVNRKRAPETELRLAQIHAVSNRWKNQKRNR